MKKILLIFISMLLLFILTIFISNKIRNNKNFTLIVGEYYGAYKKIYTFEDKSVLLSQFETIDVELDNKEIVSMKDALKSRKINLNDIIRKMQFIERKDGNEIYRSNGGFTNIKFELVKCNFENNIVITSDASNVDCHQMFMNNNIKFTFADAMNCYKKVYEFEDGTKVYSIYSTIKYKNDDKDISLKEALDKKIIKLSDLKENSNFKIYRNNDKLCPSCCG